MTDAGEPPNLPSDIASPTSGPRPRVGAGNVNASPSTAGPEVAPGAAGNGGGDDFWDIDDDAASAPAPRTPNSALRTLIEWAAVAVGALAVALLIKAFLLQAFYIPSASMDPTLKEDDRVLVNKLSYKVGDVQRGDVVVFHRPENAPGDIDDFIKRVIALEGETITFADGTIFIDGQPLSEPYLDDVPTSSSNLIQGCDNAPAVAEKCDVPDGMVFVMGDNRQFSQDSRFFGPIDMDTIVGRAFLKIWPLGDIGFL